MRIRGNSLARSLIQRMASRSSRNGSMSSTSGRCCRTSLFASSKVCAAPQTWYRGSRPMIATKPCSLMMVSPTTTTRRGSLPARELAGDITVSNLNKSARHAATHLLWFLRIQDNLLQAVADTPVTFRSRWLLLRSSKPPPQRTNLKTLAISATKGKSRAYLSHLL